MFFAAAGLASLVALSPLTHAGGHGGKMDSIHFIIPGGAGGGWDGTARGTGEVLTKSGLVGSASYENMSGGGGGKGGGEPRARVGVRARKHSQMRGSACGRVKARRRAEKRRTACVGCFCCPLNIFSYDKTSAEYRIG